MGAIDLRPGAILTRAERQRRWGGSIQGGIQPSASTPNVFVYSDPQEGRKYGYDFDGWSADGSVFFYTGEGSSGDQRLTGGNRAILLHKEHGRSLHLFVAEGGRQRGGKLHRYLGEFEVDPDLPYVREDGPDTEGQLRSVLVFRLKPVGQAERSSSDDSPFPDVQQEAESIIVPSEAVNASGYAQAPTSGGAAVRRESELSRRYETFLVGLGHSVGRCRIRPPGEIGYLFTDLFDATQNELYEVKAVATREAVRLAIGQLLDYRRHIDSQDAHLTVLLPVRPSEDLVNLIHSCGMSCVYETTPGAFDRSSA